jgi:hypothetical protein
VTFACENYEQLLAIPGVSSSNEQPSNRSQNIQENFDFNVNMGIPTDKNGNPLKGNDLAKAQAIQQKIKDRKARNRDFFRPR